MNESPKQKSPSKTKSSKDTSKGENNYIKDTNSKLEIVPTQDRSTDKIIKRRKRKLKPIFRDECDNEESEEALIDQAIEEKLQEVARKNNLSQIEMKKILRKLVGNEHVLALVKIQEDEEKCTEKGMQSDKCNDATAVSNELEDETCTPKLTRAKARALNKKPIPLPPLNETEREPEVAALISQDLHSDEEDEEYHPHEEDLGSDDDPNTTISDIDSQPPTPNTAATLAQPNSPVQYTQDGLFKVPGAINDSLTSQHEEIIAKRTRSKLCLQTTPIEAIESNFIPPDITTDMYDLDVDMDHAWMEFLNEFTKPLNAATTAEEDDETDPEYVAADKVPIDREELRDVNISRKELSDLVAELFDGLVTSGVIGEEDTPLETPKKTLERSNDRSPVKKRQKISENQSQNNQEDKPFETDHNSLSSNNVNVNLTQNETIFNPNIMSTPQDNRLKNINNESHQPNETMSAATPYQYYNSSISYPTIPMLPQAPTVAYATPPVPPIGSIIPYNTAQVCPIASIPSVVSNPHSQSQSLGNPQPALLAFHIPNTSSKLTTIPYQIAISPSKSNFGHCIAIPTAYNKSSYHSQSEIIDLTRSPEITLNGSTKSTSPIQCKLKPIQSATKPTSSRSEPALPQSTTTGETSVGVNKKKKHQISYNNLNFFQYEKWRSDIYVSINKYMRREYAEKYQALKTVTFEEEQFHEYQQGFTDFQLQILQQQMRMHVQFAAQNFFQTYSHPEFWKLANAEKQMLLNLENYSKGKENSFFKSWNLKPALKLVKEWEDELSVNNSKNRELMDFVYGEINKAKSCNSHTTATMRFHPRIMQRIIKSEVFMYPDILPKIPFRVNVNIQYHEFCPAEDHLIAFGMERYFKQLEDEEKVNSTCKRKISDLRIVCERIARDLTVGKSWRRILGRINSQSQSEEYNPIKFYYERKRSPPFKHELKHIDFDCVLAPQDRISELPLVWKEFACSVNSSELEETYPQQRYVDLLKACSEREDINFTKKTISSTTTIQKTVNQSRDNNISSENIVVHLNYVLDNAVGNNPEKLETLHTNNLCEKSKFLPNELSSESLERKGPLSDSIFNDQKDYSVDATDIKSGLDFHQAECNIQTPYSNRGASVVETTSFQQTNNACLVEEKVYKYEILENTNDQIPKGQKLLTDEGQILNNSEGQIVNNSEKHFSQKGGAIKPKHFRPAPKRRKKATRRHLKHYLKAVKHQRRLKFRLCFLVETYQTHLENLRKKYENEDLKNIFINFKALELHTNLLSDLTMSCRKVKVNSICEDSSSCTKKAKLSCESIPNAKVRKVMRINEYLKRMITPESHDDTIKKDAIYALNFYDKVEETFTKEGKYESFRKFQSILKSFDPERDQVADMYNNIERLFLPHYPDLAQIFLTFLLPGEAAQIGKFFEHFMISNMGTFISKMNLYFSKQPAQIKKVYAALNELSEDRDLTLDKIKEKILPLLKGNQFLTEWFLQIFPSERPPERLVSVPENIKFKSMEGSKNEGDCENISFDELEVDPLDDQGCQIKYLNGRIFYGNKILLPAKLTFLIDELEKENDSDSESEEDCRLKDTPEACLHGMRDLAEKRLKQATETCDDPEKSEEDDNWDNSKKYVICDNATFKAHAIRLNPSLYTSDKENQHQKKSSSPKKTLKPNIPTIMKEKEKRKSPKKTLPKSPGPKRGQSNPANISSEFCSKAVGTAKKLKSMLEGNLPDDQIKAKKQKNNDKSKVQEDDDRDIIDKFEEVHHVSDSESFLSTDDDSNGVIEVKPWTRDEDKIILEEVKLGFDNEEVLIEKLAANLSHRTKSEIIHRHQFLMDVLSQLQNRG